MISCSWEEGLVLDVKVREIFTIESAFCDMDIE